MKKRIAGAALLLTLAFGALCTTAYARNPLYSPESVTLTPPGENVPPPPGRSPKTGDINILAVEAAGLAAAGVAIASAKRSRNA